MKYWFFVILSTVVAIGLHHYNPEESYFGLVNFAMTACVLLVVCEKKADPDKIW